MSPLALSVRESLRRRSLLGGHDRVVAAVSGGSDSVALAWLLREIEPSVGWQLVGLVHVHHGLRGLDADQDEAFCRSLAVKLDLPIHVAHVDVGAQARRDRRSIEATARDLRYACFADAMAALGATATATGHTRDDQAETVLLRLLRGTSARGLSAIRPRRGPYVRPLLDCRHPELIDYLHSRGETFRTDASNADLTIPRNRLRHGLMPLLARDWPRAVAALARFAELAADDEAVLSQLALEMAPVLVRSDAHGVQLDSRALTAAPAALGRRVVRQAIESAGGVPSFRDIEAIRRLARADSSGGRLDVNGVSVERRGSVLEFRAPFRLRAAPFESTLEVPGQVRWPATGDTIRASLQEGLREGEWRERPPEVATLRADRLRLPLSVRTRRPGDRFHPLGAPGTRKLQDVLVDRKVPREDRDAVPIVVDATGRIVWVAGLAIADDCRVTAAVRGVVVLEMEKGIQ